MSQQPDDQQGSFVGGSFGPEDEQEHLPGPDDPQQEDVDEGDVEGISAEPAPGERNDPV